MGNVASRSKEHVVAHGHTLVQAPPTMAWSGWIDVGHLLQSQGIHGAPSGICDKPNQSTFEDGDDDYQAKKEAPKVRTSVVICTLRLLVTEIEAQ
jgi:hypothetical protein